MYNLKLTDEEKELGFELAEIETGYESPLSGPEYEERIVLKLSESDYLFRDQKKDGRYYYIHKRYGIEKSALKNTPSWFKIGEDEYEYPLIKNGEIILDGDYGIGSIEPVPYVEPKG